MNRLDYKELIKTYSERYPLYAISYATGYVRALYDFDSITRNQWNYLLRIINKYGVRQ